MAKNPSKLATLRRVYETQRSKLHTALARYQAQLSAKEQDQQQLAQLRQEYENALAGWLGGLPRELVAQVRMVNQLGDMDNTLEAQRVRLLETVSVQRSRVIKLEQQVQVIDRLLTRYLEKQLLAKKRRDRRSQIQPNPG